MRQMHHLLKNTIKPLFAIINELEAEGKFTKFTLTASGAKSHYLSCSKHRQGSSLHIPSRQGTLFALALFIYLIFITSLLDIIYLIFYLTVRGNSTGFGEQKTMLDQTSR